jgi:TfoX/Sxy family transcriptional regulator of competence genes
MQRHHLSRGRETEEVMAFDEALAERVRKALAPRRDVEEKRMFGGICFMVAGHMTVGVEKDRMMVRVGPEGQAAFGKEPHVRPMTFTGKPMKGFLFVGMAALTRQPAVTKWVKRCVGFTSTLPKKKGGR